MRSAGRPNPAPHRPRDLSRTPRTQVTPDLGRLLPPWAPNINSHFGHARLTAIGRLRPVRPDRGCGFVWGPVSRCACRRSCGRQVGSPVQQRLAAQPPGDGPGFGNGEGGGAIVVQAGEVPGVVEQAMGEVVGGGLFAQAADRRGEVGRGGRAGLASGKADAGQAAFGTQQRGQMPGLVVIDQGEQLTDGGSVAQVVGGASGQWPRPPYVVAADAEGADVGEDGPGVAQCGPRLAAGGGRRAAAVKPSTRLAAGPGMVRDYLRLPVPRAGLRRITAYLTPQQFVGCGERERRPGAINR
jgi:hypothetical protein